MTSSLLGSCFSYCRLYTSVFIWTGCTVNFCIRRLPWQTLVQVVTLACQIKSYPQLLQVHLFGSTFAHLLIDGSILINMWEKKWARPKLCALKTLTAVSRLGNLAFPRLLIPYVANGKETKIINYAEPVVARPLILHGSTIIQPYIFLSLIGLLTVLSSFWRPSQDMWKTRGWGRVVSIDLWKASHT